MFVITNTKSSWVYNHEVIVFMFSVSFVAKEYYTVLICNIVYSCVTNELYGVEINNYHITDKHF